MRYSEARPLIKTGDLLFWSHGGWNSMYAIKVSLVRIFTMSEYSHVGIAWVVNGRVFVIHAVSKGVCIEPLSLQGEFTWCPTGYEFSEEVLETIFSRVGERYSTWEAVLAFFGKLCVGRDAEWQCAEWVVWCYDQAGIFLRSKLTPSALAHTALENGKVLQLVTVC